MYLYTSYAPGIYDLDRRELGNMFPKPQIWYLCLNDLETGQIRSFWPHFQVEHFVYGMDVLSRVYGTLLYGSLC